MLKSTSSSSNLNNRLRSLTRSTTRKDDYDVSVADIGSSSSSTCRGDASSESSKKEKEKEKKKKEPKGDKIAKRNVSVQGLTVEEAKRIQGMMDKEWKEEKDKEKRNRLKKEEKKLFKGERKAMKEKEKSEKKKLKKQQTTLGSSGGTENRSDLDSDFLLVTDSFTRRRSHSDGAKDFDLQSLKAELAAIEKAAGQNSRHAAIKKPFSRKALEQSSILHSGYVLKKNSAGKAKGDSWERVFCVLYKRWLVFYAHKDDTEAVLRVKLKHVKHATFYRNISSLMLFDRENGFALTLDGSGGPVIHAATTTVEEGRQWSGAFQKALVSVKLA